MIKRNGRNYVEYFAQYVNDNVKAGVLRKFSVEQLSSRVDDSFNHIPLSEWDDIGLTSDVVDALKENGDFYTKSIACCINKAGAALILKELGL